MKTWTWLWLVLYASAGSMILRAEIEFRGYAKLADGTSTFSLFDTQDETSRWCRQGDGFKGYRVASFDAKTLLLTLERDGALLAVKFKNARTNEARSEPVKAVQVKITVCADGAIVLDGIDQTDEGFRTALQRMAMRGEAVALEVQSPRPPTPKSHQAITSLSSALREAGVKKWSVRVID